MEDVQSIFDEHFSDLVLEIHSREQYTSLNRRCIGLFPGRDCNIIRINPGTRELHVRATTRYDDRVVYEKLLSLLEKIDFAEKVGIPHTQQERGDILPEYKALDTTVRETDNKNDNAYRQIVVELKSMGVGTESLQPPVSRVLPAECYEIRKYVSFKGCGIAFICSDTDDIFKYIMQKYNKGSLIENDDLHTIY